MEHPVAAAMRTQARTRIGGMGLIMGTGLSVLGSTPEGTF